MNQGPPERLEDGLVELTAADLGSVGGIRIKEGRRMMLDTTCPKCQGRMEEGWIMDSSGGAPVQTQWVQGGVERKPILWGTFDEIVLQGKTRKPLTAYRCVECGFVELYAE